MAIAEVGYVAFNGHKNQYRADSCKEGAMIAEKIKMKDEVAFSRAMEKAAMNKRNVKVSLAKLPWE